MKALVVGLGHMGRFHRKVLMDLGYDVTTVDPDPTAGADYLSVPSGRHPGVVCVATPMEHLAETAAGFALHTQHLLIEKPGATTYGDALSLASLLGGQRVAVGYVERFNPVVRAVRAVLCHRATLGMFPPSGAHFTRWNDRPSSDVALDLQSHDIDLVQHLQLTCPVTLNTRAGVGVRRREIDIHGTAFGLLRYDLMDHDTSPLHAQWHSFLSDRSGYATPADAVHVLARLSPPEAVAA